MTTRLDLRYQKHYKQNGRREAPPMVPEKPEQMGRWPFNGTSSRNEADESSPTLSRRATFVGGHGGVRAGNSHLPLDHRTPTE